MKIDLNQKFESRTKHLDSKNKKRIKIEVIGRLVQKLNRTDNNQIKINLEKLIEQVPNTPIEPRQARKFLRKLKHIQKEIKKEFGYVQKESIQAWYNCWAIGFGTSIGAGFGSEFYKSPSLEEGIGFVIGIMAAVAFTTIGSRKEKRAEAAGLTY